MDKNSSPLLVMNEKNDEKGVINSKEIANPSLTDANSKTVIDGD